MKVLFVDTPGYKTVTGKYTPNSGYLYMASFLRSRGYHHVSILDAPAEKMGWNDVKEYILEHKPDLVATGGVTADILSRFFLMRMVKDIDPKVITVIGGLHASLVPEETLQSCLAIDYAIVGEGEVSFCELIEALTKGQEVSLVKGVAYFKNGKYQFSGPRPLIENLDTLSMPDYSLVPMANYKAYELPGDPYTTIGVTFSRGCKNNCSFCAEAKMWRNRQRTRSPIRMADEIEILYDRYGKRSFLIGDSDFLYSKERSQAFAQEILRRKMKINYTVMARADSVIENNDVLVVLRQSGMVSVAMGVESDSQDVLNKFKKRQDHSQVAEACALLRSAKVPIIRFLTMWGVYDEDKHSWLRILKMSRDLGADYLTHSVVLPLPGTQIFDELKKEGLIDTFHYASYRFFLPVIHNKYYSRRQLFMIQQLMHFSWWFHPMRFFRAFTDRYRFHLQFYFMPRFTFNIIRLLIKAVFRKPVKPVEESLWEGSAC